MARGPLRHIPSSPCKSAVGLSCPGLHDHNISGRVPAGAGLADVGDDAHVGDDVGMLKDLERCLAHSSFQANRECD